MSKEDAIKLVTELFTNLQLNHNMLYGEAILTLFKYADCIDKVKEELLKVKNEYIPSTELKNNLNDRQLGFVEGINTALTIINLCNNRDD